VRELKNWAERACILSQSDTIDSFAPENDGRGAPGIRVRDLEVTIEGAESDVFNFEEKSLRSARAAFEKQFILKMLSENGGNISKTAQRIGVERSHLHKKMKSYGIREANPNGDS
jgi:two-component system nitrogen regulation response regulator NtrX